VRLWITTNLLRRTVLDPKKDVVAVTGAERGVWCRPSEAVGRIRLSNSVVCERHARIRGYGRACFVL
jgi:hypothetical protein